MSNSEEIAKKAYEIILESISEGVFTVDHNWRIMTFNRAAEEITGTQRGDAIGSYCWDVFRSNMCEGACALKRTMKEGKSLVALSIGDLRECPPDYTSMRQNRCSNKPVEP